MKRIITLVLVAGLTAGCMPLATGPDAAPWAKGETKKDIPKKAEEKTAEQKIAEKVPLITPESVNENNAQKMAQALMDEIKRDANNPPKVIVEARK